MFRQILLPALTAVFVLASDVGAQQVQSLAIMHPDTANHATYSLNAGIQAVGSSAIFNGYDSEHGNELWVSSNGAVHAELLYDFTPGSIRRQYLCLHERTRVLFFGSVRERYGLPMQRRPERVCSRLSQVLIRELP